MYSDGEGECGEMRFVREEDRGKVDGWVDHYCSVMLDGCYEYRRLHPECFSIVNEQPSLEFFFRMRRGRGNDTVTKIHR